VDFMLVAFTLVDFMLVAFTLVDFMLVAFTLVDFMLVAFTLVAFILTPHFIEELSSEAAALSWDMAAGSSEEAAFIVAASS